MLKTDSSIAARFLYGSTYTLLTSTFVMGIASSVRAQEAPTLPDYQGICRSNHLAGRTIIDPQGRLIDLVDYCAQHQESQQAPVRAQARSAEANPGVGESEAFWQSFLHVANLEAVQFSNTLDRQQIIAYSGTICPYLNNGGTLQQIRQIQSGSQLPTSFDVAVTVAAIHTYCPEYTSQIGR